MESTGDDLFNIRLFEWWSNILLKEELGRGCRAYNDIHHIKLGVASS